MIEYKEVCCKCSGWIAKATHRTASTCEYRSTNTWGWTAQAQYLSSGCDLFRSLCNRIWWRSYSQRRPNPLLPLLECRSEDFFFRLGKNLKLPVVVCRSYLKKAKNADVKFETVVLNLFHAATHFATKFNLTTPFRKFPVMHMKCSCVCTKKNTMTKNTVRYHYVEQGLIH